MMNFEDIYDKRKISMFFIIVASAILFIVFIWFLLSSNISKSSSSNEVVITFADNISPAHKIIVDNFNKKYKGKIKVSTINLPFNKFSTNERKELLTRALRSKSEKIDVFSVDIIWVARFAKWCEPFNRNDLNNTESKLLKYALKSCYFENKLVGLPMYIDIALMYYRKDLIEKLPNNNKIEDALKKSITWENFIKLGLQLKKLNHPFYIYQADNFEGLVCSLTELIDNQNPKLLESKIDFQSKEIEYALQTLTDLVQKYKLSPPEVAKFKESNSWEYYVRNSGIFLRGWPGFSRDKIELLKKYHIYDLIGKAPLPHIKGSKPTSVYGGWNLMISKFSNHKKEALEFIKFFLLKSSQKILYKEGGFLPVLKLLYEDKEFLRENPDISEYYELLRNGVHRPLKTDYTRISDIFSYYSNQAIRGKIDVKTALLNANKHINSESFISK